MKITYTSPAPERSTLLIKTRRISPKADLIYGLLCHVDTELMQVGE